VKQTPKLAQWQRIQHQNPDVTDHDTVFDSTIEHQIKMKWKKGVNKRDVILQKLFVAWFTLLVLITSQGCKLPIFNRGKQTAAPELFTSMPTQEQLIGSINANASRIRQLETEVVVSVPGVPSITGSLYLEQPSRMRLNASLMGLGSNGVDVGSNEEKFWVWVKTALPGQEPVLYYARHDEYAASPTRQAIPIDPTWISEALGLVKLDPNSTIEGPFALPDGDIQLRSTYDTINGRMTKVLVIDGRRGWVKQQFLGDANQRMIANAVASDFRYYPEQQVSLPQKIQIRALPGTEQELSLNISSGNYRFDQIVARPEVLWTMPQAEGVTAIDLANPGAMPQQVGFMPRANTLSPQRPRIFPDRQARLPFLRGLETMRGNMR
jgi:hypothetical protein